MFNNRKILLLIGNIIWSFILIVLFTVIYILVDGGNFQNFLQQFMPKFREISLMGVYLVYSTTQITSMAINHLSIDVEEEKVENMLLDKNGNIIIDEKGRVLKEQAQNEVQILKSENARINNNPAMQPQKVAEYVKWRNDTKFKEKQELANQNAIRRLEARLYKKQSRLSKEKIEVKITELKEIKIKNKLQKFRLALLERKLEKIKKVSLLEKRLQKFKAGELNAKVKDFKPITRKSFYTISLQRTKDMEDMKLKVDFKRKTLTRAFFKAIIINSLTSFGLVVALQSLFDYDFANKWYALVSILGLYIATMIVKYLFTYVKGRPAYKEELIETLENINSLAKECLIYCGGKVEDIVKRT